MTSLPIRTTGQLGPYLKALRRARGWSQEQLGTRIGLSQERIAKIEGAPEKVSFDSLLTLLMALDAEFHVVDRQAPHETRQDQGEGW
ncbi:helix-turn-helix domain-containing protein [Noviherbaspirillum sp. ST9]|uniref:helix-turn-helix domain-containing protein n=1 Tax=Noviherbaspirillum sp. ST9 TaxID=3401606 RepID=UPI003B586B20